MIIYIFMITEWGGYDACGLHVIQSCHETLREARLKRIKILRKTPLYDRSDYNHPIYEYNLKTQKMKVIRGKI